MQKNNCFNTHLPMQSYTHEHQLQADCVIWFANKYPSLRGALWGNFAEQSVSLASKKLSLGLIRGLPDLMFRLNGVFVGIELKLPGTSHNIAHLVEQSEWMQNNTDIGCFCDSLSGFQYLITHIIEHVAKRRMATQGTMPEYYLDHDGLCSPLLVLNFCRSRKTKTTTWDKKNFTKFAK